jgi:photosystem II stability/assembly factor-like uncharacterized protein
VKIFLFQVVRLLPASRFRAAYPQTSGTLYAGSLAEDNGAASVSSGVLKSVDGGKNWSGTDTLWQYVTVSTVAVDPSNSGIVYAQTAPLDCDYDPCINDYYSNPDVLKNLGVYRSADGGATWAKLELPGGAPPGASQVAIDQNGTLYAAGTAYQSGLLFRSQDGGATWNALPTAGLAANPGVLTFDPQDPNHLFVGTYSAGVFEIRLAPQEE